MTPLEKIKQKLKALEEGKPKTKKWKPKDEHTVRLLPIPGDEDLAYMVKFHYGVDAGRPMYCPATDGNECPFCDVAEYLKSFKDADGNQKSPADKARDWEWFKKIEAAVKHYAPIIIRKKDSTEVEGPLLWEMSPKTYTAVFKVCANDDWNDDHPEGGALKVLTSLEHALDLVVSLKKKGTEGNKTSYDQTVVEERKKFSPIFKKEAGGLAAAKALLDKIPTIADVAKPITTEEAEKIFKVWKASMDSAPADTTNAGVEHGESVSSNNGEMPMSGGDDTDSAVAKLEALMNGG